MSRMITNFPIHLAHALDELRAYLGPERRRGLDIGGRDLQHRRHPVHDHPQVLTRPLRLCLHDHDAGA